MINLFFLFFRNGVRNFFNPENNKRIFFFPIILLILLTVLQGTVISSNDLKIIQWIGFSISFLFFIVILIGLVSNRLPSRLEDVVWIYNLPLSMEQVIWTTVMWQLFIRGGFWLVSAMLADISRWILGFPNLFLLTKALGGFILIALIELWFIAASSARGKKSLMVLLGSISGIGIIFGVLPFFFPSGNVFTFTNEIGNLFFGKFSVLSLSMLVLLVILAYIVIRIASKEPLLLEKIVREADFWSEFKDFSSMVTSIRGKDKPSYWGGDWLQGVMAYVWFEWVIMKKNFASFLLQFVFGMLLAIVILIWAPKWYSVMIFIILITSVAGGYFSGLIRHMQTGELFLLPGQWSRKAYVMEIFDLFPTFLILAFYTVLGVVIPNEFVNFHRMLLFLLLPLFIMIIGLRLWVFYRINAKDSRLLMACYYRTLILYSSFIALLIIGAIYVVQNLALPLYFSMSTLFFVIGIVLAGSGVKMYQRKILR
jgi:sporulation killing factor system integral membrane protein